MRSHIRRLLESAGFSPRQLFAALQGAWLEPKQGLIWQENTGVTPTTTGGQTIGLMLDQSGGGHDATQSTVGNRPLLGRRYNLLTYSEDFSNAAWDKINSASVNSTPVAGPTGQMNAYVVTTIAAVNSGVEQKVQVGSGVSYRMSVWAKAVSGTFGVKIGAIVGGSFTNFTLTTDWQLLTADYTAAVTGMRYFDIVSQGSAGSFRVTQADLRLTADVGKDPAYQRITTATDYDYGQYPAAIHDTNDSLTLSLPSINVRRNLLTFSEQFDNGAWAKTAASVTPNAALAPDGTATADLITATANGAGMSQDVSGYSGATATLSAYFKKGNVSNSLNSLLIRNQTAGTNLIAARVNLDTGGITYLAGSSGAVVQDVGGGWWRLIITTTAFTSGNILRANVLGGYSSAASEYSYIWGAQLELGSVATDYQKVTDWTSEAFSSNGSVYFSTPVGMSQLNNQSMATTYTLPALSSDIYSWMVFPQRLSAVQESRLALYMQQKAGIAGPEYVWESFRRNLLTWSQDLSQTNWVKIAVTNTANKITPSASSAQHFTQQNVLTIGTQYTLSFTAKADGYVWLKVVSSTKYINIDTLNGVIGLSSGMTGSIVSLGSGEYRCSVTFICSDSRCILNVAFSDNASWDSVLFAGDGTSGIIVKNVQAEFGSTATEYQRIDAGPDPYTIVQEQLTSDDSVELLLAQ